jgi:hypothetical protein
VQEAAFELNRRVILYLGFISYQIYFGFQPSSKLEIANPDINRIEARAFLAEVSALEELDDKIFDIEILYSIVEKGEIQRKFSAKSDAAKIIQKERHDMGIRGEKTYKPGQLVILYDRKSAKKKLHPAYRGPFVITRLAGSQGKSYTLRQVNRNPIPRSYYRDHLKPFTL